MADATPTAASTTSTGTSGSTDLLNLFKEVTSSTPVRGAALGALMGNLLSQYQEPGGVVKPIDMSAFPVVARTTTVPGSRFVPYSQYGVRSGMPEMTDAQTRMLGGIPGLAPAVPMSALSAVPQYLAARQPLSITSPGSGAQKAPTISLTPRSTQQISPLTGALLGAAAGYLLPSGASAGTSGGAAGGTGGTGGGGGNILDLIGGGLTKIYDWATGPNKSATGDFIDNLGRTVTTWSDGSTTVSSNPINNSSSSYTGTSSYTGNKDGGLIEHMADGGMATPLMADGGMPEPSFYTYGTAVDPRQVMQQMAQNNYAETEFANGGYARGGLHVPTVEGRHDYRSGSRVSGEGDGQSDDIPAMLADGEYVFDADTVAQLGNGSTKAGSDLLDRFREEIRSHKRSAPVNKIPPPAKSPLQYLKQAQARSKKHG
jgi:hypothetical protein